MTISNAMVPKAQYDALVEERDGWQATAEEASRPCADQLRAVEARQEGRLAAERRATVERIKSRLKSKDPIEYGFAIWAILDEEASR